jgi:hypothetical protein
VDSFQCLFYTIVALKLNPQRHVATHWTLCFTPTSNSWLNVDVGFFAKLMSRRLKHGVLHSLVDLLAAITRFIKEYNAIDARSFIWKANQDEIIVVRNRRIETLELIC